ncbi:MAG: DUF3276 family protein [Bacteroidota bacterium]
MDTEKKKLFSTMLPAGRRTYFFDLKENERGDRYLILTESKRIDETSRERNTILIPDRDIEEFYYAIEDILNFLKNNSKEKPARNDDGNSAELSAPAEEGNASTDEHQI